MTEYPMTNEAPMTKSERGTPREPTRNAVWFWPIDIDARGKTTGRRQAAAKTRPMAGEAMVESPELCRLGEASSAYVLRHSGSAILSSLRVSSLVIWSLVGLRRSLVRLPGFAVFGIALCMLAGCLRVKEHLTINADGSGVVEIEVRATLDQRLFAHVATLSTDAPSQARYPPLTEQDVKQLFPARDFTPKIQAIAGRAGETGMNVEVRFTDVNVLLSSPYGRKHALTLTREKGALRFTALSGMQAAARLSEVKPEALGLPVEARAPRPPTKGKERLRYELTVTLPNAITVSNGTASAKSAAWVTERGDAKDLKETVKALGTPMRAACSSAGIGFSPVTPPRLGLVPFRELDARPTGQKVANIDEEKIAAAARFIPYKLRISRIFDIVGEGHGQDYAGLAGVLVVPPEFLPQKWGEALVEEVIDDRGNNLKLARPKSPNRRDRYNQGAPHFAAIKDKAHRLGQRAVYLPFAVPDGRVKKIARIKATVPLHYYRGAEIVKLGNAIAKDRITKMRMDSLYARAGEPAHKPLSAPRLGELGLELSVLRVGQMGDLAVIFLHTKGPHGMLRDVQVYDASGTPWQSFMRLDLALDLSGRENTWTVVTPGKPEPPLSLALLVSSEGATVNVPIMLEDVPVSGPRRPDQTKRNGKD